LTFYFQQDPQLQTLLEVEFNLCRLPGFNIRDIREKLTTREIDWYISRLARQIQDDENKISGGIGFTKLGGKTF